MAESVGDTGGIPDKVGSKIYEAPKLTPLGNARELLAGAGGSVVDTFDPEETQAGGG